MEVWEVGAREEIRETGEPGGGLALAARVISYSMIAVFILAFVLAGTLVHGGSNSGGTGQDPASWNYP